MLPRSPVPFFSTEIGKRDRTTMQKKKKNYWFFFLIVSIYKIFFFFSLFELAGRRYNSSVSFGMYVTTQSGRKYIHVFLISREHIANFQLRSYSLMLYLQTTRTNIGFFRSATNRKCVDKMRRKKMVLEVEFFFLDVMNDYDDRTGWSISWKPIGIEIGKCEKCRGK